MRESRRVLQRLTTEEESASVDRIVRLRASEWLPESSNNEAW